MKIAIIGTGPTWDHAPTDFQKWGIPGLWNTGIKLDRLYEVHSAIRVQKIFNDEIKTAGAKLKWMKDQNIFIHPTLQTTFPNGNVMDYQKHIDMFGPYFTSSISWMIAEAIMENPEEIGIYGVSMASSSEYGHQKPSISYLLGWARAKGIKITVPDGCELLSFPWIYGLQDPPPIADTLAKKKAEVNGYMGEAEDEYLQAKAKYHHGKGFMEALEYFEDNFWSHSRKK